MAVITIDGRALSVPDQKNVLECALEAGIYIPHLCHHPDLPENGSCRMCIVEVEGQEGVVQSCLLKAKDGMVIRTKSDRLNKLRTLALELLLAGHPEGLLHLPEVRQLRAAGPHPVHRRQQRPDAAPEPGHEVRGGQPPAHPRHEPVRPVRPLRAGLPGPAGRGHPGLPEEGPGDLRGHPAQQAAGRRGLPLLHRLRRGVPHRHHPGQEADDRHEAGGRHRPLPGHLPRPHRHPPVYPLCERGQLRRGRRRHPGVRPLPQGPGLCVHPRLRGGVQAG